MFSTLWLTSACGVLTGPPNPQLIIQQQSSLVVAEGEETSVSCVVKLDEVRPQHNITYSLLNGTTPVHCNITKRKDTGNMNSHSYSLLYGKLYH